MVAAIDLGMFDHALFRMSHVPWIEMQYGGSQQNRPQDTMVFAKIQTWSQSESYVRLKSQLK